MSDMTQKNKYQLLVLYGKSGAGKDTILNATLAAHPEIFHRVVSCTTRPPRPGEIDGVDYHFINKNDVIKKTIAHEFIELSNFNGWYYGTPISSFVTDKINIAVMNPEGIANIQKKTLDSIDLYLIEVCAPDYIRIRRALDREGPTINCHELCRRFLADEQMWKDYPLIMDRRIINANDSLNLAAREDTKDLVEKILEKIAAAGQN